MSRPVSTNEYAQLRRHRVGGYRFVSPAVATVCLALVLVLATPVLRVSGGRAPAPVPPGTAPTRIPTAAPALTVAPRQNAATGRSGVGGTRPPADLRRTAEASPGQQPPPLPGTTTVSYTAARTAAAQGPPACPSRSTAPGTSGR